MTGPSLPGGSPVAGARAAAGGILFPGSDATDLAASPPDWFADLNLDQLVEAVLAGRENYDLTGLFHTPLRSVEAVRHRQQVLRDLQESAVRDCVESFAAGMRSVRKVLAASKSAHYRVQKQAIFLSAAVTYVHVVDGLVDSLREARLRSSGLAGMLEYLSGYLASPEFAALDSDTASVGRQLGDVRYRLRISADTVHVGPVLEEEDYAADVAETFARFRQGAVKSYLSKVRIETEGGHVQAAITELVAKLQPAPFRALHDFCQTHAGFVDDAVTRFDRELQFYLAYLEFADRLRHHGLPLCFPEVAEDGDVFAEQAFDPVLADKLVGDDQPVVCNDFSLRGRERILVVTGPNHGGKTTFARMFAQLHYLGALGLTVPGRSARLCLPDQIFTHFERGENLEELSGKLQDDLVRIRGILAHATEASVVVLNEIFASTSLEDAVSLGTKVLQQIGDLGSRCVCVTFLDELTDATDGTVSMVSTVDPDDPASRTFQVVRRKADGLAYAEAIARKYHVTYHDVKRRLAR